MANPIATILSAAMMLRFSFGLEAEADAIEKAVDNVLDRGLRTADIIGSSGVKPLKTFEMTDEILKAI
jgi:3-isopropylmalate dehydrogenase